MAFDDILNELMEEMEKAPAQTKRFFDLYIWACAEASHQGECAVAEIHDAVMELLHGEFPSQHSFEVKIAAAQSAADPFDAIDLVDKYDYNGPWQRQREEFERAFNMEGAAPSCQDKLLMKITVGEEEDCDTPFDFTEHGCVAPLADKICEAAFDAVYGEGNYDISRARFTPGGYYGWWRDLEYAYNKVLVPKVPLRLKAGNLNSIQELPMVWVSTGRKERLARPEEAVQYALLRQGSSGEIVLHDDLPTALYLPDVKDAEGRPTILPASLSLSKIYNHLLKLYIGLLSDIPNMVTPVIIRHSDYSYSTLEIPHLQFANCNDQYKPQERLYLAIKTDFAREAEAKTYLTEKYNYDTERMA